MDKLFVVIKREFMERIRSRWFVVMTLLMPALMATMIILPAVLAVRSSASLDLNRVIVIDATGTDLGSRVLSNLKLDSVAARKQDSIAPVHPDLRVVARGDLAKAESLATASVQKAHSWAGYLALTDSTLINGDASYAGRNASTPADMARIEAALRQSVMMVRLGKEGVRPEVIKDLSKIRVDVNAERISESGKAGSANIALGVGFFLAFLLYASIIFHGQNVLRGVLEEKTTRVAEVVLSSVKPDTLLAGKVLGVGAVGLLQQALWLVLSAGIVTYVMPFITSNLHAAVVDSAVAVKSATASAPAIAAGGNPGLAIVSVFTPQLIVTVFAFFFSGFIFYASLFAAAGAMVNSEQEAQQAAMPVMMLLILTIVFLNPIIMNSNSTMAVVLSWLPFSSPIVMPTRMALGSVGLPTVIGSWIVSVLGCVAAVWVGARIYRVGMLMYGKRPNFGELVRWVRYS